MQRLERVVIDVGDVASAGELHQLLMTALGFPGFYGRNWNAFRDAITGLVEMPEVLRLERWQQLVAALPRDAGWMKQCLDDMQRQFPEFAAKVEYA
ncbi:MAG: barstar family protein [Comamonas sp.]|uniref:barstar family protein n=1 Tax=Comamonas sp. TaxID=34028 RepID=UPI003D137E10